MNAEADDPRVGVSGPRIGALGGTMLVAGNMVGSGIFLLPAAGAKLGSMIIIGWAIVVAGALLLALVFLRLTRLNPDLEMHGHVRKACGAFAGWQSSSLYWIGSVIGNIAIAVAVTGYLTYFFQSLTTPLWSALITAVVVLLFTGVNLFGAPLIARLSGWTLMLGLAPVVIIAVTGWFVFDPAIFRASWNVTGASPLAMLPASLGLLFWAFCGVESASVVARNIRDPERNVPIATIAGVVVAALVYVLACTVLTGMMPAATLAVQSAPFAVAFEQVFGPVSAVVVALCAMFKASGTLAGWILLTAETARDAAHASLFPRFFARTNARGVPVANLAFSAAIMVGVTFLTLTPTIGRQFAILINASVLFAMTAYLWCCVALFVSDRSRTSRWLAALTLLFCLAVIFATEPIILAVYLGFLAVSPPLYLLMRRWRTPKLAVT